MAFRHSDPYSKVIRLDVGGKLYKTTTGTLEMEPDSLLASIVSHAVKKTDVVFIDRDGDAFAYVLDYLRNGTNAVLPRSRGDQARLRNEAAYYQLHGLQELLGVRGEKELPLDSEFRPGDEVKWNRMGMESRWIHFLEEINSSSIESEQTSLRPYPATISCECTTDRSFYCRHQPLIEELVLSLMVATRGVIIEAPINDGYCSEELVYSVRWRCFDGLIGGTGSRVAAGVRMRDWITMKVEGAFIEIADDVKS